MIKKLFIIQLIFSFIFSFALVLVLSYLKGTLTNDNPQIIFLALVFGILFVILNAVINSLNFSFDKLKNSFIAFHLPAIIWVVVFATELFSGMDWYMLIMIVEPIFYNLRLEQLTLRKENQKDVP
ncbi:hypothetical protein SAMN05216480_101405 [Pustulibacterium marinum]|uniref:Uncharacterized protein n=1 Tax=Pustulibacterium marinum TaxID=1224947 RepID=A0A1I7EXX1_9FLAO|nr:hypothetical protein [Pustulibacterium marinum]SFU28788.1 hypothetical protein SAMN05216480_101405 [Pustulibacterium marinum]